MSKDLGIISSPMFREWMGNVKSRIQNSQIKAAIKVNQELLSLYWDLGKEIVFLQTQASWGSSFYSTLSQELMKEFPQMKGFSVTNLKYIKKFYEFYNQRYTNRHQLGDDLTKILFGVPWRHHIEIIIKCSNIAEAMFYVNETIQNNWSRVILLNMLDSNLYRRQSRAVNNFQKHLPDGESDLAKALIKDPYNFDFLTLTKGYKERELEAALTENITKFLLELGNGFAYLGRQVPITVGRESFFIDLLFYNVELRCYVVVELKVSHFEPSYIGQLGFYVSAINNQRKKATDNPTIGLLICKTKDNVVAQYSLDGSSLPIGISEYELSKLMPKNLNSSLPSIEDIETSLNARTL